jgi:hypothetical protein
MAAVTSKRCFLVLISLAPPTYVNKNARRISKNPRDGVPDSVLHLIPRLQGAGDPARHEVGVSRGRCAAMRLIEKPAAARTRGPDGRDRARQFGDLPAGQHLHQPISHVVSCRAVAGLHRTLLPSIRRAVQTKERDAALDRVQTMDDVVVDSVSNQRIVTTLWRRWYPPSGRRV